MILQTLVFMMTSSCVIGHLEMRSNALTSAKDMTTVPRSRRAKRGAEGITAEQIKYLLDTHNQQRRWQGAADMELLVWSDELADLAKDWSRTCAWGHGQPKRDRISYEFVGQNIFAGTWGTLDEIVDIGPKGFYEEIKWRNPETMACEANKICGHYTQSVWASTSALGCDVSKCPSMRNLPSAFTNAFYMVCNYGPGGNAPGTQPFTPGPPCSQCPLGSGFCIDGLCTGACSFDSSECVCKMQCHNCGTLTDKCSCDCKRNWLGVLCENECKDSHANCDAGWPRDWCTHPQHGPYIVKACPAMCNVCTRPTDNRQCPLTAPDCRNVCANGGRSESRDNKCLCTCSQGWYGVDCRKSHSESQNGAIFKLELEYYKWAIAWENIRNIIVTETNVYCRENVQKCCPGLQQAQFTMDGHDITQYKYVLIGQGYPSSDKQDGRTEVEALVMVQLGKDNSLCKEAALKANVQGVNLNDEYLKAEVVRDILNRNTQKFDDVARKCCNGVFRGISDAPRN